MIPKKLFKSWLVALTFIAATLSCRKPNEGIVVELTNDFIKNTVFVEFKEYGTSKVPEGKINLTIEGDDKDFIYEISGKKNFQVNDGKITLMVSPERRMSVGPVKFGINASVSNYLPVSENVYVNPNDKSRHITVYLVSLNRPPAGLQFVVKNYSLSGGKMRSNSSIGAHRSAGDSVFFDDELTTVFLPSGTAFNYTELKFLGTQKETIRVAKDSAIVKEDTVFINGISTIYKNTTFKTYYENVETEHPVTRYQTTKYTGATLKVICAYATGYNDNIHILRNDEPTNTDIIEVMGGNKVRSDELLYKTAIKKKLVGIHFIGQINGLEKEVFPDSSAHWFTSYALDETAISPVTSQKIKEGDSIEVGVDHKVLKTVRVPIKKAANGQLRVECQSFDVGYYFRGEYSKFLNYQLDANPVEESIIPDPENLNAYAKVAVNGYTVLTNAVDPHGAVYDYSYKIVCSTPINVDATIDINYFGKKYKTLKLDQGLIRIFEASYFTSLPQIVTFNFILNCTGVTLHPTYFGQGKVDGKDVNINVTIGSWKTRGLTVGQVYPIRSWYGSRLIEYTLNVNNYINDVLPGEKDRTKICQIYGQN